MNLNFYRQNAQFVTASLASAYIIYALFKIHSWQNAAIYN